MAIQFPDTVHAVYEGSGYKDRVLGYQTALHAVFVRSAASLLVSSGLSESGRGVKGLEGIVVASGEIGLHLAAEKRPSKAFDLSKSVNLERENGETFT